MDSTHFRRRFRGSGQRSYADLEVLPLIRDWHADVEFLILDETVLQQSSRYKDKTVFEEVLDGAGAFIGIGRFRPRNNGFYGRFNVESIQ
jgi:hypothetical protein